MKNPPKKEVNAKGIAAKSGITIHNTKGTSIPTLLSSSMWKSLKLRSKALPKKNEKPIDNKNAWEELASFKYKDKNNGKSWQKDSIIKNHPNNLAN